MPMNCPHCGETFEEVDFELACEVHCPECGALLSGSSPKLPVITEPIAGSALPTPAAPPTDAAPGRGAAAPPTNAAPGRGAAAPPPPGAGRPAVPAPPAAQTAPAAAPVAPATPTAPATASAAGAPPPAVPPGATHAPTPAAGTAPVSLLPTPDAGAAGLPFGRYRLLATLGQGGAGVVHKAYDGAQRRLVALKILRAEDAGGPEGVERILTEARRAQKLRHPNILGIHEIGEQEGRPFISVDFVEGRTFRAYLDQARQSKPPAGKSPLDLLRHEVGILIQVAEAVLYAHGEGIAHRDLKPSNVLLDRKDRAYVMDFGLMRPLLLPPGVRLPEALARAGRPAPRFGTPAFMSPEQVLGDAARVGPPSDVWSLGVMLYEVLAGRLPFAGAGPAEVLCAVMETDPPAPRDGPRPASEDLESLIFQALDKDPGHRVASAGEFAEDLKRWLRGEPVRARKPGLLARLSRRLGLGS